MKAAVYTRLGPPDAVVQITDVEKPVPKDDEVLFKVRAAGVNPLDWHLMQGRAVYGSHTARLGQTKNQTTRR